MSYLAMAKTAKLLAQSVSFLALVALAIPAEAQDNAVQTSTNSLQPRAENGRQIYEATQFARFAPQTALDMVRQIPGFSVTEVSEDRGLGEASQNVLINGQRVTGKSNDAETALSRIPVSSVVRLEVADAASFGVSGINGQVVNIIAKDGGLQGNFAYRAELRDRLGLNPRQGEINLSGKLGKGNFTLGVNNNGGFQGGGQGVEFTRDSSGQLDYTRNIETKNTGNRPRVAGSYSLKADNGNILNVNAALELFRFRRRQDYLRFEPGAPDIIELSRGKEDEWNYELGGDYEVGLGKGRLKLIGFHRFEDSQFSNEFRRDFTDGSVPSGQRFDQDIVEGESVLRGEYRWKAGKADWQIFAGRRAQSSRCRIRVVRTDRRQLHAGTTARSDGTGRGKACANCPYLWPSVVRIAVAASQPWRRIQPAKPKRHQWPNAHLHPPQRLCLAKLEGFAKPNHIEQDAAQSWAAELRRLPRLGRCSK